MKKLIPLFCLLLLGACSKSDDEPAQNKAPTCQISEPKDKAVVLASEGLRLRGTGRDADGKIAKVTLTVGDVVIEEVTAVPFDCTLQAEKLKAGPLSISLYVEDDMGASASDEVTVTVLDDTGQTSELTVTPSTIDFGYYTEESEFTVTTDKAWTLTPDGNNWIEVYDEASAQWMPIDKLSGSGTTVVKLRSPANAVFEPHSTVFTIVTDNAAVRLEAAQQASPDILEFLEDENLRIAAQLSCAIYGVDVGDGRGSNEPDWKVSAAEVEVDPGIFGFDAGSYQVKSVKGIEHFPYLRHLDLNRNELTEIDLSGNPALRSLHVEFNPTLKSLDLSPVPLLDELGCDYELFITLDPKYKKNLNTLGVLNRLPETAQSTLDLSGCTKLARLYCYGNALTELNLSGCTGLWLLSASNNDFTELDLSDVDRQKDNKYIITECPKLQTVYVWKGFTRDYYDIFSVDDHVQVVEKE